jgi:hypothetical protein
MPMRAFFVVVLAPIRHLFTGVRKIQEPAEVRAPRSETPVEGFDEGFDEGIIRRLAGPGESVTPRWYARGS